MREKKKKKKEKSETQRTRDLASNPHQLRSTLKAPPDKGISYTLYSVQSIRHKHDSNENEPSGYKINNVSVAQSLP